MEEVIPAYWAARGVSRSMSLPKQPCHVVLVGAIAEMIVNEFCRLRQAACRTDAPSCGPPIGEARPAHRPNFRLLLGMSRHCNAARAIGCGRLLIEAVIGAIRAS